MAARDIRNLLIVVYGQAGCNANEVATLIDNTLGAKLRYSHLENMVITHVSIRQIRRILE